MTQPEEQREDGHEAGPGWMPDVDAADDDEDVEPLSDIQNECRCGECCRGLIIEVGLDDAEREPKIKELGSPIYLPGELTASGEPELEGYVLNSEHDGHACVFLEASTHLCGIYETRPAACRAFDCDGEGKDLLIQLGMRPGSGRGR